MILELEKMATSSIPQVFDVAGSVVTKPEVSSSTKVVMKNIKRNILEKNNYFS